MNNSPDENKSFSTDNSKSQDRTTSPTDGTGSDSDNLPFLHLKISESLARENIVEQFTLNNNWYFGLKLNHTYDGKVVVFQFDRDYAKLLELSERRLKDKGVQPKHIAMLTDTIDNNIEEILKFLTNRESEVKALQDRNNTANKALLVAAENCVDLFIDEDSGTPYAAVKVGEHIETLPLDGGRFRNWLSKLYYSQSKNSVLYSEASTNVIAILKARAEFGFGDITSGGKRKRLNLRVTSASNNLEKESREWWYDLTNPEWEAVKITADGRCIEKAPPTIFKRYSNQLPQVYPSEVYPPDVFDRFISLINVKDTSNKLLLKCYIVSLLIPDIAKPVLMLHGEQGTAKSTLLELIKMLVDPSIIRTLTFPTRIDELVQQLSHNYVAFYDNISLIKRYISDQLCRAVTRAGFSKRLLYTNDDDYTYSFMRVIGLSGINLAATQPDLLDRGLIIELQPIPKDKARKLQDIWAEFEKIRAPVTRLYS
jgi:hypothetical protein